MSKPVPAGACAEISETVEHKHTIQVHFHQLPPVYSTPDMIRLMETACFLALQPYAEGDEITVGTKIDIEHRAATPIGSKVTAEAVMESFDGRFYTMRVRAWDDRQEIGQGTVGRAFVSVGKFMAKISK
ncbi:MAG TPA: thioesterase family protein [Terriglobales bacterium]|nr:thioesterase family protein [Terriglobales bacterium]